VSERFANLRDAHVHIPEHGDELSRVNLADCTSRDEALERIASANPDANGWVIAVAARAQGWSDPRWPTAAELHEAAGGAPCLVRSFDFHCVVASSEALRRAKVNRDSPNPPSGVIERDDAGEPTGVLLESALKLATGAIPASTREERIEHVRRALADFARYGIVEVHDMLSRPWLAEILCAMHDAGELAHRVVLHPILEDFDECMARREEFTREGAISIGGLKIFTDGTLNSRTASMLHPYAIPRPEAPCGEQLMSRAAIDDAIARARRHDLPIVAHAIGDRAVRTLLDAFEASGPAPAGACHRIEHAQFIDEADVPRFAQLNVIASMQPCHLLPDMEALRRLTPDRMHRAFALRDLVESAERTGVDPTDLLWLGSDAPVVPPDPQDNVQAAVERRRVGMDSEEAISPEQSIDAAMVLRLSRVD
jgi:predicted amidohydrolase YtcJ